jgi:hypothetical protein
MPGALDVPFVRIELVLDEGPRGADDELLLFGEAEVHDPRPFVSTETPPSGLPAISPSRGEIDSFNLAALSATPMIGENGRDG